MRSKHHIIVSIIVFLLILQVCPLYAKTIVLQSNSNGICILEQSMFKDKGANYIIQYPFDLRNSIIELPEGTTLTFKGEGVLKNGTLIGKESNVKADSTKMIFIDVALEGIWRVRNIYSNWFNMGKDTQVNAKNLKNMCALTSDEDKGAIHITTGTYPIMVDSEQQSVIVLNSNTDLFLDGTLQLEPNDLPYYAIIDIVEKNNVKICGQGTIIGDVSKHTGTQGDWGMGIVIRASQKIIIKDVTIKECWGDCIYLGQTSNDSYNKNVTIENVTCEAGRRQGMSIIAGKNIYVKDSRFINTGTIKYTSPGAGIDIEPNHEGTVARNIVIDNCHFQGNKGNDIATKNLNRYSRIKIKNCVSKHSLAFWEDSYNITVENCDLNYLNASDEISNVKIKKSTIRKRIPGKIKKTIRIEKCTLNDEGALTLSAVALPLLALSISGVAIWVLTKTNKVA